MGPFWATTSRSATESISKSRVASAGISRPAVSIIDDDHLSGRADGFSVSGPNERRNPNETKSEGNVGQDHRTL
ncbi:hypothetical protein DESC_970006 [Desulfosarcina cetonica]|nr:hypothetical protein DESC_970006 [Desulfosarcina cetonica]